MEASVERFAAVMVLVVGGLFLLATIASVVLGQWETTLAKMAVLLLVLVGMWRASSHLQPSSPAR